MVDLLWFVFIQLTSLQSLLLFNWALEANDAIILPFSNRNSSNGDRYLIAHALQVLLTLKPRIYNRFLPEASERMGNNITGYNLNTWSSLEPWNRLDSDSSRKQKSNKAKQTTTISSFLERNGRDKGFSKRKRRPYIEWNAIKDDSNSLWLPHIKLKNKMTVKQE